MTCSEGISFAKVVIPFERTKFLGYFLPRGALRTG